MKINVIQQVDDTGDDKIADPTVIVVDSITTSSSATVSTTTTASTTSTTTSTTSASTTTTTCEASDVNETNIPRAVDGDSAGIVHITLLSYTTYSLYITSTNNIDNTGTNNEVGSEESNAVSEGIAEYEKQLVRIVSSPSQSSPISNFIVIITLYYHLHHHPSIIIIIKNYHCHHYHHHHIHRHPQLSSSSPSIIIIPLLFIYILYNLSMVASTTSRY